MGISSHESSVRTDNKLQCRSLRAETDVVGGSCEGTETHQSKWEKLKFRRTKEDFTFDKCVEHTEIANSWRGLFIDILISSIKKENS